VTDPRGTAPNPPNSGSATPRGSRANIAVKTRRLPKNPHRCRACKCSISADYRAKRSSHCRFEWRSLSIGSEGGSLSMTAPFEFFESQRLKLPRKDVVVATAAHDRQQFVAPTRFRWSPFQPARRARWVRSASNAVAEERVRFRGSWTARVQFLGANQAVEQATEG
jgi:hypothetical protein